MALTERGDRFVTRSGLPIYIAPGAMAAAKRLLVAVNRDPCSLVQAFAKSRPARDGETDAYSDDFDPFICEDMPEFVFMANREQSRWVVGTIEWRNKQSRHDALKMTKPKVRRIGGKQEVEFPDGILEPFDGLSREEMVSLKSAAIRWTQANPSDPLLFDVKSRMTELDTKLSALKSAYQAEREGKLMEVINKLETRVALLELKLGGK